MALARVKSSQTKPTLRSAWGGNFVLSDHFTKLSVTDDVWTRSCCCVAALCSAFSVSVNHSSIAQKVKKHDVKITRVTFTSDQGFFWLLYCYTSLCLLTLIFMAIQKMFCFGFCFFVFFAVKWIRNIACLFLFFPTDFSSFSVASWKKDIACHLVAETDTPHDYVRVFPSCKQKTFQATQRDAETSISFVSSCSKMLCNRSF